MLMQTLGIDKEQADLLKKLLDCDLVKLGFTEEEEEILQEVRNKIKI